MARPQCDTPLVLQKIQSILSFTQTTKGQFTLARGLGLGCRNPTLGLNVRRQLTLPKVGKWSPP